jgi:hypothetical protein
MSQPKDQIEQQKALAEETTALQTEFAKFHGSGIKAKLSDPELLTLLKEGREIIVENGTVSVVYDGEKVTVADALKRLLHDRREFVDARTLPRVAGGRGAVTCKADLKTVREKCDWIEANGGEAYEALPLHNVRSEEIKSFEQFRKLPLSEKARLTEDPEYIYRLKPSAGPHMPGAAKINTEAIERERAKNGRYASRSKR